MTDKTRPSTRTPASWEPPDELVASMVVLLKGSHSALWDEVKALEARHEGLGNRAGEELTSIVRAANPELDAVKRINLRLAIRLAACREAGLKI